MQNKIVPPASPHLGFWAEHRKFILGLAGTLALTLLVFFGQSVSRDFMASVLNVQKAAPFDGTALPIKQVPDWASLSSAEYKLSASAIASSKFIETPNYDPAVFSTQLADLNWSRSSDRALIDQLVTYPVPYMGSYESGSKEYEGSHLAIDIKIPEGTEVFAIANGIVEKVAESSSGFGKHIVIKHEDVPLLNSNETTTLYSAYAHLSAINVTKGEIVTRGQKIGLSGDTGTSTTPHLHFQIDNANAPWHPWWPFSSAEASAAGLDFFSGISAGLNKEQAMANTVNPMLWVQRYLVSGTSTSTDLHASSATTAPDTTTPAETTTTEPTTTAETTPTETTTVTTTPTTETPTVAETAAAPANYNFQFGGDSFAIVGNTANLELTARKSDGSPDTAFAPTSTITLAATGSASVNPSVLTPASFSNGTATINLINNSAGKVTLTASNSDASTEVNFIENVSSISKFGVSVPSGFAAFADQTITIQALDSAGNPTPSSSIGGTVQLSTSTGLGSFTPSTLTSSDFTQGKATVTLNYPSYDAFKIKAQEGVLIGESNNINPQVFSDVSASHANAKAIIYLKEHEIIGGYPDGSFQPAKTVSRVEALKMIELGLGVDCSAAPAPKFPDTEKSAWYASFVGCAVQHDIVGGYPDGTFGPGNTVNRAEYLKVLTGSAKAETSTPATAPYSDVAVDAWFAPFAAYAAEKNIISGNSLEPSAGMTRAEVAETIYRMIVLKQTGAASYSEDLEI